MNLWTKIKLGIMIVAFAYMVFQAFVTQSLNGKIQELENTQQKLHDQIALVEQNYNYLTSVQKASDAANKQYVKSLENTGKQTAELEKAFNTLQTAPKIIKAKNDEETNDQTSNTRTANPTPPDWRQLLDKTYCTTNPAGPNCSTGVPAN